LGLCSFGLDDYGLTVLSFFLLVIPAGFYIMGLMGGKSGRVLFSAGLVMHALSIAHRGALLGRLPLTERHDNISFVAFVIALIYLFLSRKRDMRQAANWLLPLICGVVFVAVGHRTINTVSPFMQTPWFYTHSLFYFMSFAFMGAASALGIHFVATGDAAYEVLEYRLLSIGWILLSMALFAGSVWFYLAYGTYWLWTSKELWISITWLYVGLYLHARLMTGLKGRPAAVMGVLAFAVAMFTYFGVGTVIPSPPTQF
jgi:hypothetical protein